MRFIFGMYMLYLLSKSHTYLPYMICDKCGGHLSVRTDDTKETLTKRINTYKENAKAILDFYREKGLLMTVDASHNPETVIDDAKM